MIDKPTVLVLGAGASIPFGFPSGQDLIDHICIRSRQTDEQIVNVIRVLDIGTDELQKFSNELKLAAPDSIDDFLEIRQEYQNIGKALIAVVIAGSEHPESLIGTSQPERHWYRYLLSKMRSGSNREDFHNNQLSIITFNYDRSIEFYLWLGIKSTFGLTDKEATELLLRTITIIHVHGQLDTLSNIDSKGRPYAPMLSRNGLAKCIAGIQIIHDDTSNHPQIEEAKDLLKQAEKVCFLGFGYHSFSCKRLEIRETLAGKNQENIIASTYNLTDSEIGIIINKRFGRSIKIDRDRKKDLEFLRKFSPFD